MVYINQKNIGLIVIPEAACIFSVFIRHLNLCLYNKVNKAYSSINSSLIPPLRSVSSLL